MNTFDRTSNNKYFTSPPRMDDGRHFTDYRPHCFVDNLLRMNAGVVGSNDYRRYLIENATKIMDLNRQYAQAKNGRTF